MLLQFRLSSILPGGHLRCCSLLGGLLRLSLCTLLLCVFIRGILIENSSFLQYLHMRREAVALHYMKKRDPPLSKPFVLQVNLPLWFEVWNAVGHRKKLYWYQLIDSTFFIFYFFDQYTFALKWDKVKNIPFHAQLSFSSAYRWVSRRGTSSVCDLRARAPMPHQRQRVPGRLARSQRWHHQLRQLPVCHADGVSVHHHGGLDRRAVLGECSRCDLPVQFLVTVTRLQLNCLLGSDTRQ